MQATQITFHNLRRSPALSARIRELAERLDQHHSGIVHCRVALTEEATGRRERSSTVCVRVRIPGRDFVSEQSGKDVYAALREAFDAVRRQLSEAADPERAKRQRREDFAPIRP